MMKNITLGMNGTLKSWGGWGGWGRKEYFLRLSFPAIHLGICLPQHPPLPQLPQLASTDKTKLSAITLGVAIAVLFTPLAAVATPVVRTIERSQASGTTAKIQTINVWNGNGVSISFYEVNETIKRVWIDDPSQILVDTDGCLEGINQNCQKPGAGLIHLRRIKKVNIQGLPQTPTTLLTIITENNNGERKAYSFRVAVSSGSPKYSQIAITNGVAIEVQKPLVPQLQPLTTTFKTARDIKNGIAVAVRKKLLNPSDQLYQRLQQLVAHVQLGDDISTAASIAVVSEQLVNKLIEIGQSN